MLRIAKYVFLFFIALAILAIPATTSAQIAVGISVHIGPPALPVYAQPICPGAGYLWTPGYWAYGPDGYFWVPGTWVMAPTPGLLWTPGYWGWGSGVYAWHGGYWGPHVGFYGGINYGFGYGGVGFVGGEWRGGVFHYNTAVMHVDTTVIHTTYVNRTVINNTTVNRASFNGGEGGVNAQPTAAERAAENEHHTPATSLQTQHEQAAQSDKSMLASANHGKPAVAATARPGEFHGTGVVAAHSAGGNANRPPNNAGNSHNAAQTDRPPSARTNNAASAEAKTSSNRPNPSNGSHSTASSSGADRPKSTASSTPKSNTKASKPAKPPKEHESSGKPGGHGR